MNLPPDFPRNPRGQEVHLGVFSFYLDKDGTTRCDIATMYPPADHGEVFACLKMWVDAACSGRTERTRMGPPVGREGI